MSGEPETPAVDAPAEAPPAAAAGQVPAAPAIAEPPVVETVPVPPPAPPAAEPPPEPPVPVASDLPPAQLRRVIEGLLLVANRPLGVDRIAGCLPGCSAEYVEGFLQGLAERFRKEGRGWDLRPIANGWQLLTSSDVHPWVRQLDRRELPSKLSRGALETLAIVAYRQPVTRGQLEDVRGVQCGPVLRQLMDLRLVQVVGREEQTLGRPLLYGTTDHFLQRFGLASAQDLPRSHEFGA